MACSYKITAIVVAILTIVFAGSNLYKLLQQSDEDIMQFICYHPKHDDHKDMLHRQHEEQHKRQVKSHTTEEEEESFTEKVKHKRERSEEKYEYRRKIKNENQCRNGITTPQMDGFRLLNSLGIAASSLSLISCALVFLVVSNDDAKNKQRRGFLVPYIVVHLLVVVSEVFAEVYSIHLVNKMAVLPLILLALSVMMIACYLAIMIGYYRALGSQEACDKSAKEAFDYSIMPEEKNASEA